MGTARRKTFVDNILESSKKPEVSTVGPAAYDNHAKKLNFLPRTIGTYKKDAKRHSFIDELEIKQKDFTKISPSAYADSDPIKVKLKHPRYSIPKLDTKLIRFPKERDLSPSPDAYDNAKAKDFCMIKSTRSPFNKEKKKTFTDSMASLSIT
jgi:hypothetical protein